MTLVDAAVLGVVQGLTEFLPVSSSGHLVLGGYLLGVSEQHILYDLVVHAGTLVATLTYFWPTLARMGREVVVAIRDFARGACARELISRYPEAWLLVLIVVGVAPTALVGLLFEEQIEALFGAPRLVCGALLVTGGLLVGTRWVQRASPGRLTVARALAIGLAQGLAIVPGISRSGSTIAVALYLGVSRDLAARYSFLLSVPAILGALVVKLAGGSGVSGPIEVWALAVGFGAAALTGLLALAVLVPLVRRGRLHYFAIYLLAAAILGLVFLP
ncbi:undecaprenyl-diphosphate phosphatase [Myxococcota bacterium]